MQDAIHRGAPAFYRHVAQRKATAQARQANAAQRHRRADATLLPATFHFAPSIGAPLPPPVQRKMEAFFGADFSAVRVHVGPQAQQIGALAFTRGSDIYFAPGHYMPHHSHGQRLLGHELAHVVQQRAGHVRNPFGSGIAVVQDRTMEAEADRMGVRAAAQVPGGGPQATFPGKRNEGAAFPDPAPPCARAVVQRSKSAMDIDSDDDFDWSTYPVQQSIYGNRPKLTSFAGLGGDDDPFDHTYKGKQVRASFYKGTYDNLKRGQTNNGVFSCGLGSSCQVNNGIILLTSTGVEDYSAEGCGPYKNHTKPHIDHYNPDWIVRLKSIEKKNLSIQDFKQEVQQAYNAGSLRILHKKCNLSRPKS